MFRALSFALYGTETYHVLLRLLCVIEVLTNSELYDTSHGNFYEPYKFDEWLQLPNYSNFISSLSEMNSHCDMLAVLAASSVTQKSIQTIWPLQVNPGQLSPFTKLVIGRGINMCRRPVVLLWTVNVYTPRVVKQNAKDVEGYHINHFVTLIEHPVQPEVIIGLDAEPSSIESVNSSSSASYTEASTAQDEVTLCDGMPLTDNRNLSLAHCISVLTDIDKASMVSEVPNGIKSNMYFVVSAAENDQRLLTGKNRVFYDDCGAWAHVRRYNSVIVGDNPKELYERNGNVCDRKRIDGKDTLIPLEPQPDPGSIRKVTRYYYKLKRCPTFSKRITLLSGSQGYICEYLGKFLDVVESHGNCFARWVRVRTY